jgi:hypothetical protein
MPARRQGLDMTAIRTPNSIQLRHGTGAVPGVPEAYDQLQQQIARSARQPLGNLVCQRQ